MLKKISVELTIQGMYVHELCGSWLHNPFWQTSFPIDSADKLKKLKASGVKELWIDTARGLDLPGDEEDEAQPEPRPAAAAAPAYSLPKPAPTGMAAELERASKLVAKSKAQVTSMFNEARMGKLSDVSAAVPLVEEIAGSVARNPRALVSLVRLKQADDYTYLHSVAVCAMMIVLARQLNLSDEEVRDCGMAGLLHDVGKMAIPPEVLNKPGKLTDEEFALVKKHPVAGYKLLLEGARVPPIALDVCLHHHEKYDGSGYPQGLKAQEISIYARMGAVCDVYDAITSTRCYKPGWCPSDSLRRMAEWTKGGHFDPVIFAAFIKCIGIYPLGTLLKLKSGKLGVVADNTKSLLQPVIRAFFSTKSMSYIPPENIDLAVPGARDEIVSREDASKWGFTDLERYWVEPA